MVVQTVHTTRNGEVYLQKISMLTPQPRISLNTNLLDTLVLVVESR